MKLDRFINRPVLSTVISVLIVILGFLGLVSLPITQYPDIAPPTVQVSTTYTGANAQTVLNSVIAPLEEEINGVENMDYMTSTATNTGQATITITFKMGTDPDMAAVNVQNRVSKAQGVLPAEVTKVGVVTSKRQNSMLMVFSVYDESDKYPETFIENYAKINVIPEVQRVPGVGDAMVMGADYSMRIWLKPDVMAQYHLMPSDVTEALNEQNIEAAPGTIGERGNQTYQYTLRYKGRLQEVSEFENIVIKADPSGNILRLKDIAKVELGRVTYGYKNKVNGHTGVTCIVFQVAGSNATTIVENITQLLEESKKDMPDGLNINIAQNVNDFLFASIHEVVKTLIEAFILVFIVVYVFLQDLRSTLIPTIAIPVALIGTFFALYIIGFSLNLLTLCALVLAIAIVVDDAIVVVEGVHAKLDQGYTSPKKASIDAMEELGSAIVSITLVMMAVFIPVSFMGGTSGTFYRQFGLTMAIAIGFSALNALTLSPALCALLLKPHDPNAHKKTTFVSRFHTAFNAFYDSVLQRYKKRVLKVIQRPWLTGGAVVVSIVLLVFLMNVTPTGMVPDEDTGTIMGTVTLPPGTSQDRTEAVLSQIDSLVAASPAIESRTMISGYSFIGGQGASYGSFICKLKPWDERSLAESSQAVYGNLYLRSKELFKDAQVLFFAPPMISGYGVTNGFELNLQDRTGGSLDKFYEVAKNFLADLEKRPEIASAQTSFNPSFPQYMVDIDVAQCKKAGLSPDDILTTLQGYLGGMYTSNFNRFGKLYRVMVQSDFSDRTNIESLKKIKVRNGDEMAPITQFITLKRVYGPDNINRFNMYTSMKVNGSPADGYTSGQAIKAIEEVAAQSLPQGYSFEFSGITREEQSSSGSTTAIVFVLCFVFIYLLLSAQYESYILPLAVLLSVPFGLCGSFLFVQGMGALNNILPILGAASNNIYVQIAMIMLIGLLAKNAILIVEFAIDRRKMGMSITWSAVLGAGARLRPILMTSLAMIIGLLPMMFSFGVGANGNRSLGATAIGGMLIGMICQIFIVPALFVIFEYVQEKFKPMTWDDIDNTDAEADIAQYTK
ncbi:hydrophobe/amphiphile efflux-1 (HAE1) family RND transporter [Prevotella sp. CAG:617]|jgi:HAE1 family hydrophobic/amphiphilic exporter-1|nr:hydrophobe/amphiphile efflux-1 (HAE1) family RND transporter [Prevotella sp. CAG:617]